MQRKSRCLTPCDICTYIHLYLHLPIHKYLHLSISTSTHIHIYIYLYLLSPPSTLLSSSVIPPVAIFDQAQCSVQIVRIQVSRWYADYAWCQEQRQVSLIRHDPILARRF